MPPRRHTEERPSNGGADDPTSHRGDQLQGPSHDEALRASIERRSDHLAHEFREISRIELTLTEDGANVSVHGHVTGKNRDVGAHAEAGEAGPAADKVLDKLEKQLRTLHDKRIFTQRRSAPTASTEEADLRSLTRESGQAQRNSRRALPVAVSRRAISSGGPSPTILPPAGPASRPEIDHVIGGSNHVEVVLDRDHAGSRVDHPIDAAQQRHHVRAGCSPVVGSSST